MASENRVVTEVVTEARPAARLRGQHLLTDRMLRNAKGSGRDRFLRDGNGLYARIHTTAPGERPTITFHYRYSLNGRRCWLNLGTYPTMTLGEARAARDEAAKLVEKGIDPRLHEQRLREERAAQEAAQAREKTVRALFEDWQRVHLAHAWKDGGKLVRSFLEEDVFPSIGTMRAKEVRKADVVEILDRILSRGARRKANAVLSMLKQMFAWALARGIVETDPTQGLRRAHAGGIERPRERNLSFEEIAELAKRLPQAGLPLRVQAALWLLLATGARVAELVGAEWSEFDLERAEWRIPAERSKNGRPHVVHLSRFALGWLERLAELGTGRLLFEGRKAGEPLSPTWIGKCLRDRQRSTALRGRSRKTGVLLLPGGEWRVHDLRRTMASRMGDLGVAPHIVEKCLNHALGGILRVYQHQEYLPERRAAFERWGAELARLSAGDSAPANVLPLRRPALA